MSFSWRQRMRRAKQAIMERLGLTEQDWEYIWNNISDFCSESDAQVQLVYGDSCNIDEKVNQMYEDEFLEMACDLIEKVMKQLGYKKKKAKKKRKVKDEQTDKEVEDDVVQNEEELEEKAEEQEAELVNA